MASTAQKLLGMVPGLALGLAGIGKQQGWFGGGPLSSADQATNNSVWANLGKGMNADGSSNKNTGYAGAPAAAPAAPRPAAPAHAQIPFQAPAGLFAMPGQTNPMAYMSPLEMMMQRAPQGGGPAPMPQQPAAVAGLLGAPDEQSTQNFLRAQLGGPAALPPMPAVAGGSSTQAANPFLYNQLYGNQRG